MCLKNVENKSYLGPALRVDNNVCCVCKPLQAWTTWLFNLNTDFSLWKMHPNIMNTFQCDIWCTALSAS